MFAFFFGWALAGGSFFFLTGSSGVICSKHMFAPPRRQTASRML